LLNPTQPFFICLKVIIFIVTKYHTAKKNCLLLIAITISLSIGNSFVYAQSGSIYDLYDLIMCGKIVYKDNNGLTEISGAIYTIEVENYYKGHVSTKLDAVGSEDSNGPRSMMPLEVGQRAIFYVNSFDQKYYILSPYTAKVSRCDYDYDPSPLGQYRFGVNISEIHCQLGYDLVIKQSKDTPACVTPETKEILFERGWAKPINSSQN
jgi:hypothetical protein